MKRKNKVVILLILSLFVLFGALFFSVRSIDFFDIKEVKVNISGPVENITDEIARIIQPCRGKNIFEVNGSELKKSLLKCNGVSETSVKRYFPDTLVVNIDFKKYLVKTSNDGNFYLADQTSMYSVSKEVFDSFTRVPIIEIDPSYCAFLSKWGYDEGFFRAIIIAGNVKSNLITNIKYDNNNGNDFGRLIFDLKALGVQLYVCEAVSEERVYEALDILKNLISIPEDGLRYDLYSDSLIKRS